MIICLVVDHRLLGLFSDVDTFVRELFEYVDQGSMLYGVFLSNGSDPLRIRDIDDPHLTISVDNNHGDTWSLTIKDDNKTLLLVNTEVPVESDPTITLSPFVRNTINGINTDRYHDLPSNGEE